MEQSKKDEINKLLAEERAGEAMNLMVNASTALSIQLIHIVDAMPEWPEAIASIALMGSSIALTKTSGFIKKEEYLLLVSEMWDKQSANFKNVAVH